jgi:hypothetical protein
MQERHRSIIVTAYYKEDRALLERCIASVRRQDHPTDHILVADGHPQDWIDAMPVRHLRLDRAHGDYGNTPRTMGAMLAISEDYDGIGFLDADNWLAGNHVSLCLKAASHVQRCDFVIARRNFRRPDETTLPFREDPVDIHVDTNCFYFLAGSFHLLPHFGMIPKPLSALGDRIFYFVLRQAKLRSAVLTEKTVNYQCLWASFYAACGEPPPPGAKPNIDPTAAYRWLKNESVRRAEIASRRAGVELTQWMKDHVVRFVRSEGGDG